MRTARTTLLLLVLLADADAFKFLTNFKFASLIPRPSAMLKSRKAAKTFGKGPTAKKLAVITGASSGVGLETAARLLGTGEYHVFGAVRDLDKMRCVSNEMDFPADDFTPLEVDLESFDSVRAFCKELEKAKLNRPIDRLICNAATYQPDETPEHTVDGHEQILQVNYLSHFLLVSLLLPGMAMAADPRVIMVGGAGVQEGVGAYPRADLGALQGLQGGSTDPMVDSSSFLAAKAYKDSKLSLGLFSNMLHRRYHKQTGIAFSTIYPGSIEDSALVAGKPSLDSSVALPGFVKAIADLELSTLKSLGLGDNLHAEGIIAAPAAVTTAEAGARLFQVAYDVRCSRSGFWSWKEGEAAAAAEAAAEDGELIGNNWQKEVSKVGWESIYESEPSDQLADVTLGQELWKHSTLVTGAKWPPANVPKSPCPTLKVVGAVTNAMNAKEDAKRSLQGIEPGSKKAGLGGKVLGSTGYVVDAIGGNTIGRVAKLAQDKLLGDIPVDAIEGTYQETAARAEEVKAKIDDALAEGLKIDVAQESP